MPNKNFTNFTLKDTPTKSDFFVGYDSDGSVELRSQISKIVDLSVSEIAPDINQLREEIDRNNLTGTYTLIDEYGDFLGDNNDLLFTASAIQKNISYNGIIFAMAGVANPNLTLKVGYNYDLYLSSSTPLAIRKGSSVNIEELPEIYNNDVLNGVMSKQLMWTPKTAGTYKIVDVLTPTKSLTFYVIQ